MTDEQKLLLAGGGGLAIGAFLMGIAAQRQQRQALATEQAIAAIPAAIPIPEYVTSPSTLTNGWTYFVTFTVTGKDLTTAADQASVAAELQTAGFVDPSTQAAPTIKPVSSTVGQALTTYNGTTGSNVPAATADLTWSTILSYPPPG
jgi:hypothetical protein